MIIICLTFLISVVFPQVEKQQDVVTVKELKQLLSGASGSEALYDVTMLCPDSTACALLELSPFEFITLSGEVRLRLPRDKYDEMVRKLGEYLPSEIMMEFPLIEDKPEVLPQKEANIDSLYKVYSSRCAVIYDHLQEYTPPEVEEVYKFLLITPQKYNMAETEEWMSELQYAMLQCFPQQMMDGINMLSDEQRATVLKELSMPIHDGFDFQRIRKNLDEVYCIDKEFLEKLKSLQDKFIAEIALYTE